MERREFLRKTALAGAATVLGSRIPILTSSAFADGSAGATTGCQWGIHAEPHTRGGSLYTAVTNLEKLVGRRFAIDRQYHRWDVPLPTKYEQWTRANGRTPYVSWNSYLRNGTPISWAQIASGKHDAWVRAQAQSIRQWGRKMYFTFNHEPENDASHCGSSAAYKAAFAHIVGVFANQGVDNVTWVVALMASTFNGQNGGPNNWMPNTHFDVVGVDGYNRWPCYRHNGRKSFYEIFAHAQAYASRVHKPLAICEYGTLEDYACGNTGGDPAGKARWLNTGADWIKTWGNVTFAAYSHVFGQFHRKPMAFWADTSTLSLEAFTQIGQLPYFR
jgi:hypothetical protein